MLLCPNFSQVKHKRVNHLFGLVLLFLIYIILIHHFFSLVWFKVLEALEMCTSCEVDGDIEYEFPCLNFVETLEGLWLRDDKRFPNPIYGGVRLHTSFQSGAQLKYLFPRIQVMQSHGLSMLDFSWHGYQYSKGFRPKTLYPWLGSDLDLVLH